jgi:signal transduction histidine kinase
VTSLLRAFKTSLFIRLVLIFGSTLVLFIIIGLGGAHLIFKERMEDIKGHDYFEQHLLTIINDIGTPPELEKAAALATQFPMTFLITGPDFRWQSDQRKIKLENIKVRHTLNKGTKVIRVGRARGFLINRGEYQFYLFSKEHLFRHRDIIIIYCALGVAIAVLFLNYWLVRRLFKPIRLLKHGAEKISQGDLDYRVEHKRNDELGDLTHSINSMADSLQDMLAAKQQLLLAISHELRTPITRAKVQLEFLSDQAIKKSLQDEINEIDLLVSELLEAERLNSNHTSLNLETTLLSQFVQESLSHYWPDHSAIESQFPDQDQQVMIDKLRISLLLRNLVNNALRYAGGSPILICVDYDEQHAVLSIKDRGDGIPVEHLPHLTEPFYRADTARQRETGGFGLGLYLCRLIAEAHGGKLSLQSEVGAGTRVSVTIAYSIKDRR